MIRTDTSVEKKGRFLPQNRMPYSNSFPPPSMAESSSELDDDSAVMGIWGGPLDPQLLRGRIFCLALGGLLYNQPKQSTQHTNTEHMGAQFRCFWGD
jgi:hypothetical protein